MEIQNLISLLAEAKTLVYQEIIKEIEKLTNHKTELEDNEKRLKIEVNDYPLFSPDVIETNILKMRKLIYKKTTEQIKPVLKVLIREIVISNDEIVSKVNLNAYISGQCRKELELAIVEETENVKISEKHINQKLTWSTLVFKE